MVASWLSKSWITWSSSPFLFDTLPKVLLFQHFNRYLRFDSTFWRLKPAQISLVVQPTNFWHFPWKKDVLATCFQIGKIEGHPSLWISISNKSGTSYWHCWQSIPVKENVHMLPSYSNKTVTVPNKSPWQVVELSFSGFHSPPFNWWYFLFESLIHM